MFFRFILLVGNLIVSWIRRRTHKISGTFGVFQNFTLSLVKFSHFFFVHNLGYHLTRHRYKFLVMIDRILNNPFQSWIGLIFNFSHPFILDLNILFRVKLFIYFHEITFYFQNLIHHICSIASINWTFHWFPLNSIETKEYRI